MELANLKNAAFTCEGCNIQPEQVVNFEMDDGCSVKWFTACPECFAIVNVDGLNPQKIAMVERMLAFKSEWPVKADLNRVCHAASFVDSDKDRAIELALEWSRNGKNTPNHWAN